MKIVYIGSVEIGYTILESVYDSGFSVNTVFTLEFEKKDQTSGFVDFGPLALKNNSKVPPTPTPPIYHTTDAFLQ